MRINYAQDVLLESNANSDPYAQFTVWFDDAKLSEKEPNAMCLSTSTKEGRPSARIVLLKGYDSRGFTFYTNYRSRKSLELLSNPFAALTFYWGERSVRVEGRCEKVDAVESDRYFASRPRGSQIGAWASKGQSEVLRGREELEEAQREAEERFKEGEVKRPEFWGGFRVVPERIEFWQGRPSRLHDRLVYVASEDGWKLERLSP
ncbi:pyridoxamine 5'-phosphate oxidase [Chytridium lagenaria]|nr:pyridoxamine 5'-phosphate oxidase [Chytridium lagenaria]